MSDVSTVTGHRGPTRARKTAAATEAASIARKRGKARRLAVELAPRTGYLDDDTLVALCTNVLAEVQRRYLTDPVREQLADLWGDEV